MSAPGSRHMMAAAQGGVCPWCNLPLPDDLSDVAVDHIIPRCRGGPDVSWNRQLLHSTCNAPDGKGSKLTDEARELAERRGVVLHEPLPTGWPGSNAPLSSRKLNPARAIRQGGQKIAIPRGVTQAAIHALRKAGHEVDEEVIRVIIVGILPSLERHVRREGATHGR